MKVIFKKFKNTPKKQKITHDLPLQKMLKKTLNKGKIILVSVFPLSLKLSIAFAMIKTEIKHIITF
jgi:hypothetical protein